MHQLGDKKIVNEVQATHFSAFVCIKQNLITGRVNGEDCKTGTQISDFPSLGLMQKHELMPVFFLSLRPNPISHQMCVISGLFMYVSVHVDKAI